MSNTKLIGVNDPPSPDLSEKSLRSNHSMSDIQETGDTKLIESPKMTNIHEFVDRDSSIEDKHIAVRILGSTFKQVDFKEYANYLGNPDNRSILREFVKLLQPLPCSLVLALFKLSKSLYFIAEAGAIDNILEEVSIQWLDKHSLPHYQNNYKLSHIILFSILILNSDLYNDMAQEKFSSDQFVENTMYALNREAEDLDQEVFQAELELYYNTLQSQPLPLYHNSSTASSLRTQQSHSTFRKPSTIFSLRSSNKLERTNSRSSFVSMATSINTIATRETNAMANWKYHHDQQLEKLYVEETSDNTYNNVNGSSWLMDYYIYIYEPVSTSNFGTPTLAPHSSSPKKKFFNWFRKPSKDSFFKENDKLVVNPHNEKKWNYSRVKISEGHLFIFIFKSLLPNESWDLATCKKRCSSYSVYNLFGTFAHLTQDNIVSNNTHKNWNFTITFPRGIDSNKDRVFHFQTQDMDRAQLYVQCCNFWSARITPIPSAQFEMVSNQEYGWGEKILNNEREIDSVNLTEWKPLISIESIYDDIDDSVIGKLTMDGQVYDLEQFTEQLSSLIDYHNKIKSKMISLWSKADAVSFEKAMDNWNNRYLYLNKQYEKHIVYLNALQKALKVIDEDL